MFAVVGEVENGLGQRPTQYFMFRGVVLDTSPENGHRGAETRVPVDGVTDCPGRHLRRDLYFRFNGIEGTYLHS